MIRVKTPIVLSLVAAFALTACAAPQADDPYAKTKTGAVVGGLLGGLTGAITGKKGRKSVVKGAIIGAAAGGVVGSVLDQQERALRSEMSGDVDIRNTGDRLIVTLPHDLLFDTDSAQLTPPLRRDLRALAANLNQYPNSTVQVNGHTDWVGEADYNLKLSRRRANSVARVLVNNGVGSGRVVTNGFGEAQPVATNQTEAGRRQNRRVEIVILPTA